MVAIKSHEADRFLAKDAAGFAAYLVFGSDLGLVSERVRRIGRVLVEDLSDPFQWVRLAGDDVATDPGRLADEANTIPLFGGRRAVLIEPGLKSVVPALDHHLANPGGCPVVVEAGVLKRDAPLRRLIERARTAVAIECHPDEERDLVRLVDAEIAEAGLAIEPEARTLLVGLLGSDRLASRAEIAKLALYAHGRARVTVEDVEAAVADASALATDALIDATFSGDIAGIEEAGRRVLGHGVDAGVLLGATLRHATFLHRATLDLAAGTPVDQVLAGAARIGAASPRRKASLERQLKRASPEALGRAVIRLGEDIGRIRLSPALAPSLALRALWTIARMVATGPHP